MFPSFDFFEYKQIESTSNDVLSLDVIIKDFQDIVFCDVCKFGAKGQFFHCNTCLSADFDLCQKCFDRGLHCHERDHFLVEMTSKQGWLIVSDNYHSNLKADGLRETMQL